MPPKTKEVEGLMLKVAELETLFILLLGLLEAKTVITRDEINTLYEIAEIPEILGARIKLIENSGEALLKARKTFLSETLNLTDPFETPELFEEANPSEKVPTASLTDSKESG